MTDPLLYPEGFLRDFPSGTLGLIRPTPCRLTRHSGHLNGGH